MSDSLRPHESQHARPPCPSPTLGVYSNSCPSSRWCHPAISSSVVPFCSCPQPLPASGSISVTQLFEVAEVLEFQLQHQSFQWTHRTNSPKTNHCGDKSLFSNRPTLYGEYMVLKGIWENEHLQNIYCVSDTAISTTQNIELVVFQFLF